MTPKEKAIELTDSYYDLIYERDGSEDQQWANYFALLAVDQIIESFSAFDFSLNYIMNRDYWLEVKQEIKKL